MYVIQMSMPKIPLKRWCVAFKVYHRQVIECTVCVDIFSLLFKYSTVAFAFNIIFIIFANNLM